MKKEEFKFKGKLEGDLKVKLEMFPHIIMTDTLCDFKDGDKVEITIKKLKKQENLK